MTLAAEPNHTAERDTGTQVAGPAGRTLGPAVKLGSFDVEIGRNRLLGKMFGLEAELGSLGHYELLGELGRGGMGIVHAARDTRLDRKVAIKQLQGGRPQHQRRLLREALAMAKLSHPNVVPIYEIGEHGSSTFIVMEFVEGHTLAVWQQQQHTRAELLSVYKAAARGLIAAHQKRLVHRDFKPDNVMVGNDGRVRVMDFGLSSVVSDSDELASADTAVHEAEQLDASAGLPAKRLTHTGALMGTPAYMSPEQFHAEPADEASDQFNFCVALYEGLYGERPFAGRTMTELAVAVTKGEIRPAPDRSTVPTWLRTIICRGLATKPHDRFESMQALVDALVEGELAHDEHRRQPPDYVFVAHDSRDKQRVLRLCEALIDHGVRPWLDMWEIQPGEDRQASLERALSEAPAVIVCGGSALAGALADRLRRDPKTVYAARFDGSEPSAPGDRQRTVALDDARWDDGVLELVRLIGSDLERDGWLEREAARAGLDPQQLCPYRGLEAFREQDARWMFGREDEVESLLELIRADQTRFLTLIGSSGSGKSSLLMAGVCPMLRHGALADGHEWSIAYLRPGPRPCEALAHALVGLEPSGDAVEDGLKIKRLWTELLNGTDTLRLILGRRRGRRTLLVIDQLEELFTEAGLSLDTRDGEALAFVRNLLEAAQELAGLDGNLWITATLRADFVQRGLEIPELARALQVGTYFALPPMSEAQIRAAVERPAARVGYRVESGLVDKLVAAAAHQAGRLPLLQHVLRELWGRRDEQRRMLCDAVYDQTGGLDGAIAVAAERALDDLRAQLGADGELTTRRLMTRLVHLGNRTSEDTRRRVTLTELGDDAMTRRVLEALITQARVLVAAEVDGVETVEIAHEALLREWTTLVRWLDADREALKLRQELARDAVYRGSASAREYLWGRARVEEAQRVLAASVVQLNDAERSFLDASARLVRRRRWRWQGGVAAMLSAAGIVVAIVSGQKAEVVRKNQEVEAEKERAERERQAADDARTRADEERKNSDRARTQAEQAKIQAEKSQKENERSVRQMFEVALRPLTEWLIRRQASVGVVGIDERWTSLLTRDGRALVAASLGEDFRVVVAGHEALLSYAGADGRSLFLEITTQWLLADQARRKIALVAPSPGANAGLELVERNLLRLGQQVEVVSSIDDDAALGEVGMLILDARWVEVLSEDDAAALAAFVARGGGVLAIGHGRAWLDDAPADELEPSLDDYPINTALAAFGARWSADEVGADELAREELPAIVNFENQLAVDINLLTRSGDRVEYYTTLAPGESLELLTVIGRAWVFRSAADDHELGTVVIEDEEQTVRVGETVAKIGNKPKATRAASVPKTTQWREKLTDEDMARAEAEARRAAKACGQELGTLMPDMSLRVVIGKDGRVATTVMPPAKGSNEAACVVKAMSKLRLPRSREGGEASWKVQLY